MINLPRILFVGIGFYDYEKAIKTEIERRGFVVDYFNSAYESLIIRILMRLKLGGLVRKIRSRYIQNKLDSLKNEYQYVFIIKAEGFDESNLLGLKRKFSESIVRIYLWDSLERVENSKFLLKYFEKQIFTFDRKDSLIYNLKFRPLFFRESSEGRLNDILYDLSFIGWMHSDRYSLIKRMRDFCEENNLEFKFVLFIGRIDFFLKYYFSHVIRKKDKDLFSFTALPYAEYLDVSMRSNVILDIAHPLQSGLTMRTIEAIGLSKQILTTNEDLQSYDIIDKKQYCILNRAENPSLQFMRNDNYKFEPSHYFSLSCFVEEILFS